MVEIICAGISAITAVLVAYMGAKQTKERKRIDARAQRGEKESRLSMELMSATLDLSYVTSLAVMNQHTNGNVEAAQQKARAAQDAYDKFIRETAAHAVANS